MERLRLSTKTLALIAVAMLVAAGTYAVASIPGSNGVITACWDHNNDTNHFGTLRVIDPSLPTTGHSNYEYSCLTNETPITWNQQGPAGPSGPSGPSGPAGPQGPRGPTATSSLLSFNSRGSYMFLKLGDIQGEATDHKHKDEIELLSMSFTGGGGGSGSAKPKIGEVVLTKHVDKSSPNLFLAAADGKHFEKAIIFVAKKKGGQKIDYLRFTMTGVIVTGAKSTSSSNPKPTEQITLNFTKLSEEFVGNQRSTISLTPNQIRSP